MFSLRLRQARSWTLGSLLLALAPATAAQSVDAGADQYGPYPVPQFLDGNVEGLAPVRFWLADGDGANENFVIRYDEDLGQSTLLLSDGVNIVGWPSDILRIDGTLYGIDTFFQQIYTIDNEVTGDVTFLGSPFAAGHIRISSLAGHGTDCAKYFANGHLHPLCRQNFYARGRETFGPRRTPRHTCDPSRGTPDSQNRRRTDTALRRGLSGGSVLSHFLARCGQGYRHAPGYRRQGAG
jgi:hypothetical protein